MYYKLSRHQRHTIWQKSFSQTPRQNYFQHSCLARAHCETLQHAQFNLNGISVDLTFTGALAAVFAPLLARPKMPEKSVAKATIARTVKTFGYPCSNMLRKL
jgi:hypothetical protein